MKKMIAIFVVLFLQSLNLYAQNYSSKKLSDTSVVILSESEKTDTLYEKNGIVKIVQTTTKIPVATIMFPENLDYYHAYSLFYDYKRMGKSDSSRISNWDTVVYHPEYGYFMKTEKSSSKYAYLDEKEMRVFVKEFSQEKTLLSPGLCLFAPTFVLFLFFGSFFSKAYKKREELRFGDGRNIKFWTYVCSTFSLLLVVVVISGLILGAKTDVFFGIVVSAVMLFFLSFDYEDRTFTLLLVLFCACGAGIFAGIPKSIGLFFITIFVMVMANIVGRIIPTPKFLLK